MEEGLRTKRELWIKTKTGTLRMISTNSLSNYDSIRGGIVGRTPFPVAKTGQGRKLNNFYPFNMDNRRKNGKQRVREKKESGGEKKRDLMCPSNLQTKAKSETPGCLLNNAARVTGVKPARKGSRGGFVAILALKGCKTPMERHLQGGMN